MSKSSNKNFVISIVASNGWVFRNLLETDLLKNAKLIEKVIYNLKKRYAVIPIIKVNDAAKRVKKNAIFKRKISKF